MRFIAYSNLVTLSRRRDALLWSLHALGNGHEWAIASALASKTSSIWKGIVNLRRLKLHNNKISVNSINRNSGNHRIGLQIRWISMSKKVSQNHPTTQLETLVSQDKTYTPHIMNDAFRIWDECSNKDALKMREQLYNYLLASESELGRDLVLKLYDRVPEDELLPMDLQNRLHVLIHQGDLDAIEDSVISAVGTLPRGSIIDALMLVVARGGDDHQLYDGNIAWCVGFVGQVLEKLHPSGTQFLDAQMFRGERELLKSLLERIKSTTRTAKISPDSPTGKIPTLISKLGSDIQTCCLDICCRNGDQSTAELIYETKLVQNKAKPVDLHRLMSGYLAQGEYDKLLAVYNRHSDLHDEKDQYDVLLACYAAMKDWTKLQELFESLFAVEAHLPNIKHYGIVMTAISQIARVDIVEMLHKGLVNRNLSPTCETLNAVLYARFAFGDTPGVVEFLGEFEKFNVQPNEASYTILMTAYRQSKDYKQGLELLRFLNASSITPTNRILLPLIALCADRRDPVAAMSILRWMEEQHIEPSLWGYNSIISCLVESNMMNRAIQVYELMKKGSSEIKPQLDTVTTILNGYVRLNQHRGVKKMIEEAQAQNFAPDKYYYSVLMKYHAKNRNMSKALELMATMREKSGISPNVYHYSILMHGYMYAHQSENALKLYAEMKNNVTPTFEIHALYLRALSTSKNPVWTREAEIVLEDFLKSPNLLDMTSNFLTRDKVPPKMLKWVILTYLRKKDYESADKMMECYYESNPDAVNNFLVLMLDIQLRRARGEWTAVAKIWDRLEEKIGDTLIRDQNSSRYIIPPRYRGEFGRALNAKLLQLLHADKLDQVQPLVSALREKYGLVLTNSNLNHLVTMYLSDPKYHSKSLKLADKLMKGYLRRVTYSMQTPQRESARRIGSSLPSSSSEPNLVYPSQYYLFQRSLRSMSMEFPSIVEATLVDERLDCQNEADALNYLSEKYPNIVKAILRLTDWHDQKMQSLMY